MKFELVPRRAGWFLAITAVKLAFAATTAFGQGAWAVYVMNADGSDVKRVNRDERSLFGSPDSNQLVFIGYKGGQMRASSTDSEGEVAVVDAQASAKPSVVCRSRVGWHPDWSPRGRKLLFRIHEGRRLSPLCGWQGD